jgi:Sortilin, neurotensin receptor 3,
VNTMYSRASLTFVIVFLSLMTALAQAQLTLPGGDIRAIVADPTNPTVFYASSPGKGVYRSTDQGVNWILGDSGLNDKQIADLDMHPYNNSLLFASTPSGIFQSVDAGSNWVLLSSPVEVTQMDIDASDPDHMLATTKDHGVYLSPNGGQTWVTTWSKGTSSTSSDAAGPTIAITDRQNGSDIQAGTDAKFSISIRNFDILTASDVLIIVSWTKGGSRDGLRLSMAPSQGSCDSSGVCRLGNIPSNGGVGIDVTGTTLRGIAATYKLKVSYRLRSVSERITTISNQPAASAGGGDGGGGSVGLVFVLMLTLCVAFRHRTGGRARSSAMSARP